MGSHIAFLAVNKPVDISSSRSDAALQVYQQEASKLGLDLASSPHKVKEFSLTSLHGDYRRLVHRPQGLKWQLLAYLDGNQDLGYTDLDALRKKPHPVFDTLNPGILLLELILGLKRSLLAEIVWPALNVQ